MRTLEISIEDIRRRWRRNGSGWKQGRDFILHKLFGNPHTPPAVQGKVIDPAENDLWHHPRKYIVPLIMFLVAGLIGMWSISIWVLLCIVIAEGFSLSLIVRRI